MSTCDDLEFYRSFHQNSINKLIHFFCIPLIMISVINLLTPLIPKIKIKLKEFDPYLQVNMGQFIPTMFVYYYFFQYGLKIGFVMTIYIRFLLFVSESWREIDKEWYKHSKFLFVIAWIMQFVGHGIEGNRPALLTSLKQSVFQAPVFTLEYIYPSLLSSL